MPTNLPAEAKHKWAEASAAKNAPEKLQLLGEFLSLVPKHKGTAKLRSQVKKRMAALRREIEERKKRRVGKGGPKFFIQKEGSAQLAVIGSTNVGKSSLLVATTNARVRVSPNPYTTRKPVPGMFAYEDLQFQLVEAPPLMEGSSAGKAWGLQSLALARNADGLILMVDLSRDPVGQLSFVWKELEKARIFVTKPKAHVEVEKKPMGVGLRIVSFGKLLDCNTRDIKKLLRSYRITDAVVKIHGEATLDEIEESIFESTVYKPAVVIANKADLDGSAVAFELLEAEVDGELPILGVSCKTQQGLGRLGKVLFELLDLIRVYTKEPNVKDFSRRPFLLEKGSIVSDLAENVHSDFRENFSFAMVWAERLVFSPQKVGSTFRLEDGDVVEIHMR
jgi:ribosome-interacting GTPase 1